MTCSFSQEGGRPPCEPTIGWSVPLFQDVWSVPSVVDMNICTSIFAWTHLSWKNPLVGLPGPLMPPGATVAKGHKTIEMYSQGPDVQDPGASGTGLF